MRLKKSATRLALMAFIFLLMPLTAQAALPAAQAAPPDWQPNVNYNQGDQVVYNGLVYAARQAHYSQTGWEPPNVPSLWLRPTPANGLPWTTQTHYTVGSEATYNGKLYQSQQAHVSQTGWEPPNVPSLWVEIPDNRPQYPFPQSDNGIEYVEGTKFPQNADDTDVKNYFNQWAKDYLVKVNDNQWRVAMGKSGQEDWNRTTSEAQGYGLVIVAYMAGCDCFPNGWTAKQVFDGLYNFSRQNASGINPNLMTWHVPITWKGKNTGNDSAFDGDADIAYALIVANKQWPNQGYKQKALDVINAIQASTIGPDSLLPMLGDWVDPNQTEPWGTNKHVINQYTPRLSDFMTAHFQAYAETTGETQYWADVQESVRDIILQVENPLTSLVPDFAFAFIVDTEGNLQRVPARPAPEDFLGSDEEEGFSNSYSYNACRVPLRLGIDALIYEDASHVRSYVRRLVGWFRDGGSDSPDGDPAKIRNGYELTGAYNPEAINEPFNSLAFVAPLGVAAMSDPDGQAFLDDIYDHVKSNHQNKYYEDTVNMLSLIVLTKNYWPPSNPPDN